MQQKNDYFIDKNANLQYYAMILFKKLFIKFYSERAWIKRFT